MSPLGYTSLENEVHIDSLDIKGKIPEWLSGTLVRNGPAKYEVGSKKLHWLDGLAMLHAFHLERGKVSYTNKYLRSDYYHSVTENRKLPYRTFASDPCRTLFKRFFSIFYSLKDLNLLAQNANINITKIANHYIAMTEVPLSVEFDLESLETLGVFQYEDSLHQGLRFETAHPHEDSIKKEMVNYYATIGSSPSYNLFSISHHCTSRKLIASHRVKRPAYMHSFAITPQYVVLVEYPFRVNPLSLFLKRKPFIYNYRWNSDLETHILIFDRESGELKSEHVAPPLFAFHHVNAFEDRQGIMLDLIAYKDSSVIFSEEIVYNDKKKIIRLECAFPRKRAFLKILSSNALEMPRIHYETHNAKPYNWVYGVGANGEILKINVSTGKTLVWQENQCQAGEPIFISDHFSSNEDSGVVLSLVLDLRKINSFLIVLDAKKFSEIARATLPHAIPYGLHGKFFR